MSQFIIFRPKGGHMLPQNFQPFPIEGDAFLQAAAVGIFGTDNSHNFFSGKFKNTDFDGFFTSVQRSISTGAHYFQTDLFFTIEELLDCVGDLALWYGDDYYNLPLASNKASLHNYVELALNDERAELYVKYMYDTRVCDSELS